MNSPSDVILTRLPDTPLTIFTIWSPFRNGEAGFSVGKELGSVRIRKIDEPDLHLGENVWSVSEAYVKPAYRHQGVLREILEQVIRDHGVKMIHIERDRVYKLLSDMLALTVEIQASPLCADIVKQMRNDLRSKYQIRTQSNSPVASIVVRYVSRTGRKMAHVYERVIQIAVDSEISAEKLPQFIRDNGGIESIRKKAATAAENESSRTRFEKTRNKLVAAIDPRNLPSLGTVQFADGRKVLNSNGHTEYRLLLCKSGDGLDVPQIVGVLAPNKEIEDTALRDYIICCGIASMSETESFYSLCKEVGYDMDDVLRCWS